MFDLQAISSVAPTDDLLICIIAIVVAAVFANLAILPKLFSCDHRSANVLLALSSFGFVAAAATLMAMPTKLSLAVLSYILVFTFAGLAFSWRSLGWPQTIARILGGSSCMFMALVVAHVAAFMPR